MADTPPARAQVAHDRKPWIKAVFQLTLPSTEDIEVRLEELRGTADATQKARFITILLAVVLIGGLVLAGTIWAGWSRPLIVVIGLVAALAVMLLRQFSGEEILEEIRDLELEKQFQDAAGDREERAYRLFKRHERELRKYYNLTLRQSRWMMTVGIVCVALGVVVVAVAGYLVVTKTGGDKWMTSAVAALGAMGGILTNYVAGTYLKMHAATAQAVNDFHNRLVSTHHLHVANYLVSKIETPAAREAALDKIVAELAKH
jgi:MFS family permease